MVTTMDVAALTVDAFNKVGTTTAENEAIIVTTMVKKLFSKQQTRWYFSFGKNIYRPPNIVFFSFISSDYATKVGNRLSLSLRFDMAFTLRSSQSVFIWDRVNRNYDPSKP